jgi:hypothetical protein
MDEKDFCNNNNNNRERTHPTGQLTHADNVPNFPVVKASVFAAMKSFESPGPQNIRSASRFVGFADGEAEGETVGNDVGTTVGAALAVGANVGALEGAAVSMQAISGASTTLPITFHWVSCFICNSVKAVLFATINWDWPATHRPKSLR